jgi:hypothetical protein
MAKMQRQWKVGSDWVEGVSEQGRWLRCIGRAKVGKSEVLLFRPTRKARKRHSAP